VRQVRQITKKSPFAALFPHIHRKVRQTIKKTLQTRAITGLSLAAPEGVCRTWVRQVKVRQEMRQVRQMINKRERKMTIFEKQNPVTKLMVTRK